MNKQPYDSFKFNWLVTPDAPDFVTTPEQGDVIWFDYPLSPDMGVAGFQNCHLNLNMTLFQMVHRFTPAMTGRLIHLAEVHASFHEPTLQIQIARGGRILHLERHPDAELVYSPGLDLFRYSDLIDLTPVLDGSSHVEMTALMVGQEVLRSLIGEGNAEHLLSGLGLLPSPKVLVQPVPLPISTLLHGAVSTSLTGARKKLHCQARVLDYLGALLDHVLLERHAIPRERAAVERAHAIHDFLMGTEGKLPTLDELATQFGRSARSLNMEFTAEFGESIYAFITAQRLNEAHAAIQNTPVALKVLASRLGYAHVNHFSAAFRKKFGYAPGSLRKK